LPQKTKFRECCALVLYCEQNLSLQLRFPCSGHLLIVKDKNEQKVLINPGFVHFGHRQYYLTFTTCRTAVLMAQKDLNMWFFPRRVKPSFVSKPPDSFHCRPITHTLIHSLWDNIRGKYATTITDQNPCILRSNYMCISQIFFESLYGIYTASQFCIHQSKMRATFETHSEAWSFVSFFIKEIILSGCDIPQTLTKLDVWHNLWKCFLLLWLIHILIKIYFAADEYPYHNSVNMRVQKWPVTAHYWIDARTQSTLCGAIHFHSASNITSFTHRHSSHRDLAAGR